MKSILISIFVFLGATFILASILEAFLNERRKVKLKEYLEELWIRLADADNLIVIKALIKIVYDLLNTLLGKKLLSFKAIRTAIIINSIILISVLSLTGIFTGKVFIMKEYPWEIYQKAIDSTKEQLKTPIKVKKDDSEEKYEKEIELKLNNFKRKFIKLDSTMWKIFYTIFFVFIVLFVSGIGSFISYTFTKLIIKEMVDTRGVLTLFGLFILNTFIALVIAIVTLTTLILLILPTSWGEFIILASQSIKSFVLTFSIILPVIVAIFFFILSILGFTGEPNWFMFTTLITMLPTILLYFFIILLISLWFFKGEIKGIISYLLLKGLDYKSGVIGFSVVILGILASLINIVFMLFY